MSDNLTSNDLIEFNEINDSLNRLSAISTKPLKNLSPDEMKDYNLITTNISRLYGTDGYNLLYKEILQHFPDNNNIIPGTVAGYFIGCKATSNFKYGDECSILHLAGAPFFQDNGEQKSCAKSVFLAPFDNGYTFSELTVGEGDKSTAIVYITPPFYGFSNEEKQELESKGIKNVIISYYDEKSNTYLTSPIRTTTATPIRTPIIPRVEPKVIKSENIEVIETKTSSCGLSTIAGIIIILLIISIVIYIGYRYQKNKSK
jgi:hypothetical protein